MTVLSTLPPETTTNSAAVISGRFSTASTHAAPNTDAPNKTSGAGIPVDVHDVIACLEDGKAEDITAIDLKGKTSVSDHMVIASGTSRRQLHGLADKLSRLLKGQGHAVDIEGEGDADWVLVDAGDVIVHLFRPELRSHYNLESMWG